MGGSKPLYSYDALFEVLKDMPVFFENGELKKSTDPVWKAAINRLPGMNLKNLYIFVRQDRKDIRTNLMKYLNITEAPPFTKPKKKPPVKKKFSKWDDFEYYDILDDKNIKDDLDSLVSLKKDYSKIVHKLGLVPFSVIYFHPKQVTLWNDIINVKSTVALIALNHLVINVQGKLESNNVCLYAIAVKLSNFHSLVGQMLSDTNDTNEIQSFFNCWLQNKAKAPLEIVIGYSQSLLDAASLSFNFCTFEQYNLRCFHYLMGKISDLPPTLILIDIITIIKIVDSWISFENVLQQVKDFYLCSIMYISTIENIDEFNKAVVNMLTMCQSPFQTPETSWRKDSLWVHLTSDAIEQMNQTYCSYVTANGSKCFSFLNHRHNVIPSPATDEIYKHINRLKLEAFKLCDFNMDSEKDANDFYCPIIIEDLIQLLVKFPSWTKTIMKKPDCSSLVSYCSNKHLNNLSELRKPRRPRPFIEYHLTKLQALNKSGCTFVKNIRNTSKYSEKEFQNNHSHLYQPDSAVGVLDSRIEIFVPEKLEHEDILFENVENAQVANTSTSSNEKAQMEVITGDNYIEEFDPMDTTMPQDYEALENNSMERVLIKGALEDESVLKTFKSKIYSTVHSLTDFDDYVDNVLRMKIKPGQELDVCKVFLECCKEIIVYEKFIGETARRLCESDETFKEQFEQLFSEIYFTLDSFNKHEIKNISEFYAQLLSTESISWEIFSIVKLNESDASMDKRSFIRVLLQNLSVYFGILKLNEKLKDKKFEGAFKGLFPENKKDAIFAGNFFKLCGLKTLGLEIAQLDIYKNNTTERKIVTSPLVKFNPHDNK